MRTKFFTLFIYLMFVSLGANAQFRGLFRILTNDMGGARNIYLGYSPFGLEHLKISLKDEKYKYDYKSFQNFSLGYETQTEGLAYLTEVSYSKAKFNKYDLTGTSPWFNSTQSENITNFSFTQLFGYTINNFKRLQVPIYIGPRFEYLKGGPFHNLTINACAKARVKFYITNSIGVYVGGTAYIGWGSKKAYNDKNSSSKKHYNIVPSSAYVDAGLVIGINNTHKNQ